MRSWSKLSIITKYGNASHSRCAIIDKRRWSEVERTGYHSRKRHALCSAGLFETLVELANEISRRHAYSMGYQREQEAQKAEMHEWIYRRLQLEE